MLYFGIQESGADNVALCKHKNDLLVRLLSLVHSTLTLKLILCFQIIGFTFVNYICKSTGAFLFYHHNRS